MLYFLEKMEKSPQRCYPHHLLQFVTRVVTPITVTDRFVTDRLVTSFEEVVYSTNVIAVKKNLKIAIMFCSCPHFLLQTLRKVPEQTPLTQISRHRNNYDLYYLIIE